MADGWILVLNAGSSSLKFAAYDQHSLKGLASGQVAGIGKEAVLHFGETKQPTSAADHGAALKAALDTLAPLGGPPSVVGHRVVHGGLQNQPVRINADTRQIIKDAGAFAPLHNPPALKVIDALAARHPDLPQMACFDTAFHAGNPEVATTFALPRELREKGLRRYGFHGLSYASLVRRFREVTSKPLPNRLLAFHLGAGASIAAILNGKGVATTMGFSPLDGLTMATRAGSLDPGVVLHLLGKGEMDAEKVTHILNHESGLKALAGDPEMKNLLASDGENAKFAVEHFIYWAARHAGSMIAAMQGVDGIVFTGGIGENAAPVRDGILDRLRWTRINPTHQVWVIKADEEGEIAQAVKDLVQ